MKKKILNYYLPNIIFNIFEIFVILIVGIVLGVKFGHILAIFIAFILNKTIFGHSMHYKDWYLCLIWSTILFASYYLLALIDIKIALLSTITFVFLSNVSNIKDLKNLFFWSGNSLNKEVFNWVKFNPNNEKLLKYEEKLKQTDKQKYYIFEYRFREFKSYDEIADLMGLDSTARVAEELKIISHFIEYSIRLDN